METDVREHGECRAQDDGLRHQGGYLRPWVPSHSVQYAGRIRAVVRHGHRTADEPQGTNNVRAAYTHKAEFLEERRMIMSWWSRFLEANRENPMTPHEFAKQTGENVTRLRSAKRT